MRLSLLAALLLLSLPCHAGAQARPVHLEARAAGACFERFAEGRSLPPAPAPRQESLLLQILTEGAQHNPAAAEARRRLRHCLPASLSFDPRVTRSQARWLAGCFGDAEDAEDARACRVVGLALATYDPDVGEMFSRTLLERPEPGISLHPLAHPGSETSRTRPLLQSFARAATGLAQCRTAHGVGRVRVAAFRGEGGWVLRSWSEEGAGALAECVGAALSSAADVPEATHFVFTVGLSEPT
ncbi:MAG: hypothetical protein AB8I08_22690 [Sandaracinaceae bacterium]